MNENDGNMTTRRHVSAAHLAQRTGLTARWFTGAACEGKIPGAVQPSGPGGAWRFDEAKFRRWWGARNNDPCETMPGHRIVNKITGYDRRNINLAKGQVYFVRDGRAVKIGWALNGKERIKLLQTGNPRGLTLLGAIKGPITLERALHKHFKRNRIRGEWFTATKNLVAVISIIEDENGAERAR